MAKQKQTVLYTGPASYLLQTDFSFLAADTPNSESIEVEGFSVVGIVVPTSFEGTGLTLQVSLDGINYKTLTNLSAITVAANAASKIPPADIFGWPWIRFVSGDAIIADRACSIILKKF